MHSEVTVVTCCISEGMASVRERDWLNLESRYDMDVTEDELGKRVTQEVRLFTAVA